MALSADSVQRSNTAPRPGCECHGDATETETVPPSPVAGGCTIQRDNDRRRHDINNNGTIRRPARLLSTRSRTNLVPFRPLLQGLGSFRTTRGMLETDRLRGLRRAGAHRFESGASGWMVSGGSFNMRFFFSKGCGKVDVGVLQWGKSDASRRSYLWVTA